jgi:isopenicillin-N epimerase
MREQWRLDPAILYLNHGTVGAPPRRVLDRQSAIRDEIERQPSRALLRELSGLVGSPPPGPTRIRRAAAAVAPFVGAESSDFVFVENATTGINTVLRSIPLAHGDDILLTDHAYGAIRNAATFAASARGGRVATVRLPFPVASRQSIVEAVSEALTPRTRLAIVEHITSESALVLPIGEIAARCHDRGVAVLVDGAHAPGTVPLDLPALGVDWYVGTLHKWAWAPRGCGFLWASRKQQAALHPLVISWGLGRGFAAEFDWVGTSDPSAYLTAPDAIAFMQELGADAVRRHNHGLAWAAGRHLSAAWGSEIGVDESMIGCMVTVALPGRAGATERDAGALRDALLFEDGIEVQLHAWGGRLWVRVSMQVYNEIDDVERLRAAIAARI